VKGEIAGVDTIVNNGSVVSHTTHRHEPPVSDLPIGIIHEDDEMLVIDKPPGIPVHGAGRYFHNTVVEILKAERPNLIPRPCNRLDRLTSGVMFMGKTAKATEKFCKQLQARSLQKEYVARVNGRFPDGVVLCDQPIMSISPKLGLNRVRATGKDAKTKFRRLAYYPPQKANDDGSINEEDGYSIVHCLPLTGRTHQIRVHLQFLGYPISNDPIYSNLRVFGPDLGKHDDSDQRDTEIIDRLNNMGKTELADTTSYRTHITCPPAVPPDTDPTIVEAMLAREHEAAVDRYHQRKGEKLSGGICDVCETPLYTDPGPHELIIFLHAARYSDHACSWSYKSKLPSWAIPPEGLEGPTEIPEWREPGEDEELIINNGYQSKTEDGDDTREDDIMALVHGVGVINVSQRVRNGENPEALVE
jgi:tRNA pseudouridine synthase 9